MPSFSRRQSVATAGVFAARGYARIVGAGERLRVGVIGCGGMATGHMKGLVRVKDTDNFEVAAVCDVYDRNLQQAAQLTGAKTYKDYRALLANKDIDYVLIAVPEHWRHRNLQNAIRRNEPLKCDTMLGYYGVVACAMGVESYRKRKCMAWDKQKERIVRA